MKRPPVSVSFPRHVTRLAAKPFSAGAALVALEVSARVILTESIRIARTPDPVTETLLRVGAGAHAVLIEEFGTGTGSVREWSHRTRIELAKDARVTVVSIERAGSGVSLALTQHATCAEGACIEWINATLGEADTERTLRSDLSGPDARSDVRWMFYASGKERYRMRAHTVFAARSGAGEITMRGVAEETTDVKCDGMIEIAEGGAGTATYLTQEVLMLDPTARVDAVPGLEIRCNDVKASHSATVTRVTEEDLFYFASRGIPPEDARRMFVEGFLSALVAAVPDADARGLLEDGIARKYAAHRV